MSRMTIKKSILICQLAPMKVLNRSNHFKKIWQEFLSMIRFGIVGLAATGVHIFVVWLFLHLTSYPTLIANTFAFMTAFGVSFTGHYYWTFQTPGNPKKAIKRFLLIALFGFFINTVILTAILEIGWLSQMGSVIVSLFIVPFITFLGSRLWGFRKNS